MHWHDGIFRFSVVAWAAAVVLSGILGLSGSGPSGRLGVAGRSRSESYGVALVSHAELRDESRELPTVVWDDPQVAPRDARPAALRASSVSGALSLVAPPPEDGWTVPWPPPTRLLRQLDQLAAPPSQHWSARVVATLDRIHAADPPSRGETIELLRELQGLAQQTLRLAQEELDSNDARVRLLSAGYGLQRRLDVWQAVMAATAPQATAEVTRIQLQSVRQMLPMLEQVRREMRGAKSAQAWEKYLMLPELEGWAHSAEPHDDRDRDQVVHQVLERLSEAEAMPEHRAFIKSEAVRVFQRGLRDWSTRPVDFARWLQQLEEMETQPSAAVSADLAAVNRQLHWSRVAPQNEVSAVFARHYRNANLRLTVTEDFVNRLVPVIQDVRSPVREEILGAQVLGNSATWTEVRVKFLPDPTSAHLQLLANGNVAAQTTSFKGPVVLYNRNRSEFFLRKEIVIHPQGIEIGKSDAVASGNSYLLGLQTQFDKFPVLGAVVRRAAKQQLTEQKQLTRRIFERRVARRAEEQIDAEVTAQMTAAEKRLEETLLAPLERMRLDPQALQLLTTEAGDQRRIVFRGRLAGQHQLAAFTPRPRAFAHNLVSLQLHESALNNFVEQLDLGGHRGDLRELLASIYQRFPALGQEVPEEVPEDVMIQLADHDALRFTFDEDCVRLMLRVAELSAGRQTWKYFVVTVRYLPQSSGFQVELARDGVVELVGRRLRFADQVALRGIFVKVFSQNRNFKLVLPELANDPRLTDLVVDQVALRDGWLGLSIADQPLKVAQRRAP